MCVSHDLVPDHKAYDKVSAIDTAIFFIKSTSFNLASNRRRGGREEG
jgi:hypothetical protein